MKLLFTLTQIVASFKGLLGSERLFKAPFEEMEWVDAGHPRPLEYPNRVYILGRTLWDQAAVTHLVLAARKDEIRLKFSTDGLYLSSGDGDAFSSTTLCSSGLFYKYHLHSTFGFSLLKSEFLALLEASSRSECLLKIFFGEERAPVLMDIEGSGEGIFVRYVLSTMFEKSSIEDCTVAESDEESTHVEDEFAIPGTPEYVY